MTRPEGYAAVGHTCPDIDKSLRDLRALAVLLERIRASNIQLRANAAAWETARRAEDAQRRAERAEDAERTLTAELRRLKIRHEKGKPSEGWAELLFEIEGRNFEDMVLFFERVRSRVAAYRRSAIVAYIQELDGPELPGNVACSTAVVTLQRLLWARLS